MTQKERLTEIVKDSLVRHIDRIESLAENIVNDLVANDVIALPCKIGATIYDISEFYEPMLYHPEMYEYQAGYITVMRDVDGETMFEIDGADYKYKDFGKTVFLTREEAEKALAKMDA